MQHHHINITQFCVFCSADDESLLHLFLRCPFARACWFGSPLSLIPSSSITDFKCWLLQQLDIFSKPDHNLIPQCKFFIVLLYNIWESTNHVLHRGVTASPTHVINKTLFITQRIWEAQNSVPNSLITSHHTSSTTHYNSLHSRHLHSKDIVHFFIHRNRGMLCVFAMSTTVKDCSSSLVVSGIS